MLQLLQTVMAITKQDEQLTDEAYSIWARDARHQVVWKCVPTSVKWDPQYASMLHTTAVHIHSVAFAARLDELEPLCALANAFVPRALPARIVLSVALDSNRAAMIARLGVPQADADADKAAFRKPEWERPRGHWAYAPASPK